MAQGRGSASVGVVFGAVLLCLLLHSEVARAAIYTVGDGGGWTFNTVSWPRGKRFRAGDVLVFKYNPSVHNVVAVDGRSYSSCGTPRGAKIYKSGNDRITLARGTSYFICNLPGHCQSGMKIAVTAA
ncbi:hypothetical protein QJS04_geneDACA014563 [Acorus gramineus]|uniref:Plantacyanin n=1 Tax=Acorus gramineus TaxID=55184 RepID=A0AAV9AP66_ACOGR|nr:hypothetical protein QJS04_geneDACA014563 [Acorus gramineus]